MMQQPMEFEPIPASFRLPIRSLGSLQSAFGHLVRVLGEPHRRGERDFPGDPDHQRVIWRVRHVRTGSILCVWEWDSDKATYAANTVWHAFWTDPEGHPGIGEQLLKDLQAKIRGERA